MTSLMVDTRMIGQHGIGRYAREVTRRMTVPWTPIALRTDLYALTDPFRRRHLPRGGVLYSPGYRAGLWDGPQYLTLHDLIHIRPESRLRYRAYYETLLKPKIRQAGLVFTVSNTSRAAIDRWLHDDSVRIVVTGNGCSEEFTTEGPSRRSTSPYFLFVGNLKPHKNLPTLMRALARIPQVNLVAVTDDIRGALSLASTFGVEKRVKAISAISDQVLAEYYRGASATVVPSTVEGFGLPALESLACGTPVIYWRGCDSVLEIVGDQGIAVDESKDAVEWARALAAAVESKIAVDADAVAARFAWQSVARTVEATLLGLVRGH